MSVAILAQVEQGPCRIWKVFANLEPTTVVGNKFTA